MAGMKSRTSRLALVLVLAPVAACAESLQVKWEGLSVVVGKTVSIAMPAGAVVQGKAKAVTPEYLEVDVRKTSNPAAVPKGARRVPRAELRTLEMHTKGKLYRTLGTTLGALAGFAGGIAAFIGINGGILNDNHPALAATALFGIAAGGTVAGYLVGNAADRRTVTIQIVQ
jgi:hypothetical protein